MTLGTGWRTFPRTAGTSGWSSACAVSGAALSIAEPGSSWNGFLRPFRKAKIKVRRALLYYALKRLGLDTEPSARRPQDQQIVLVNRGEIASGFHLNNSGEARV